MPALVLAGIPLALVPVGKASMVLGGAAAADEARVIFSMLRLISPKMPPLFREDELAGGPGIPPLLPYAEGPLGEPPRPDLLFRRSRSWLINGFDTGLESKSSGLLPTPMAAATAI